VDNIRAHSPIIRELEQTGAVRIVGAIYDMHTGAVDLLD
jgi:carbonic anhydrase